MSNVRVNDFQKTTAGGLEGGQDSEQNLIRSCFEALIEGDTMGVPDAGLVEWRFKFDLPQETARTLSALLCRVLLGPNEADSGGICYYVKSDEGVETEVTVDRREGLHEAALHWWGRYDRRCELEPDNLEDKLPLTPESFRHPS